MLVVAALSLVGCGGGSSSKQDTNTNNDNTVQNIAPSVSLTNQTVIEKSEVTISASASDTDGTIQAYQWQQTSGINVELSNTTSNQLKFSAPSIEENTDLTFKLTVTDDDGAQASASMTLTVEAENEAPSVSLTNQTVIEKSEVTISASASDTDGTIQAYQWQQTSGINVELSNTTSNQLSFSAPSIVEKTDLTFKLTVTDDDGAQTSESMTLTIEPNIIASFTLSGEVTTGKAIANANITAQLGDLQFTTQSNEVGSYQLNINVDDDYQDQLLTLSATGSSTNSVIKLVSELGNIDDVVELAESHENKLSTDEHIGLKLSHFSTVVAALMVQQNSNQALANVEQYQLALSNLNFGIVKTYAAMNKYLIDNISDLPAELLPDNLENTYQLFTNKQAISSLFYAFNNYDRYLLNDLEHDVLVTDQAFGKSVKLEFNTPYYLGFGKLVLNQNGTGSLITLQAKEQSAITWTQNDSGLNLVFDEPMLYHIEYIYPKNSYDQVRAVGYINNYKINTVFTGNNLSILRVTFVIEYKDIFTKEVIETESEISETFFTTLSRNKKLTNEALTPIKPSKDYIISMSLPNLPLHYNSPNDPSPVAIEMTAAKVRFNAESSKTATIESVIDKDFNTELHNTEWLINSEGELELAADKLKVKIAKLQDKSDAQAKVMTFTQEVIEPHKVSPEIGNIYEIDKSLTWTNDNVPGVYSYEYKSRDLDPNKAGWYELREDGTLSYFYVEESGTPLGKIDESHVFESVGLWRIINNELVLRRYRGNEDIVGNVAHCHSESWETNANSECIMYIERRWQNVQLTAQPQNQHVVLQKTHYYMDFQRSYFDPDNEIPANEHLYWHISQLVTEFTRSNERPVQLPEGYIPIKDRTNSKATPVKTNDPLFNEKLELSLN
ncbi:PKD domain-containing protein [Pseudoalteromonas sp. SSM20]|uniref:carboxypeptidase-like regulatory domain-containing protein n=1 Tax=Pseudoalteromonas sp. SSM20 TaxID=3139394 RepID=UPI003BADA405